MDKINIVIPMAGAGSRFKIAGYKEPKPFIVFNGKMMIEHVLNSFSDIPAIFTLVIQEKFQQEQSKQLKILEQKYDIQFATVPKLTMGAAITALASRSKVNKKYPVIFADSDNIFDKNTINEFAKFSTESNLDGCIMTFNANENKYSYAKTNSNNLLVETKEKEVISNNAICGVYYFKNFELFENATIDMIIANDLSKNEFYMSNTYNHLLKYTNKIKIFPISESNFHCVGTPEQLNNYIKEGETNAKIQ